MSDRATIRLVSRIDATDASLEQYLVLTYGEVEELAATNDARRVSEMRRILAAAMQVHMLGPAAKKWQR